MYAENNWYSILRIFFVSKVSQMIFDWFVVESDASGNSEKK